MLYQRHWLCGVFFQASVSIFNPLTNHQLIAQEVVSSVMGLVFTRMVGIFQINMHSPLGAVCPWASCVYVWQIPSCCVITRTYYYVSFMVFSWLNKNLKVSKFIPLSVLHVQILCVSLWQDYIENTQTHNQSLFVSQYKHRMCAEDL